MDRIWQLLVTHHNFLLLYHNNPQKSDYMPLSFQFIASGNKLNPLPINTFKAKSFFAKIPRKTNVLQRIPFHFPFYLLFLSNLPLYEGNLRFRAFLYKSQDVIHHAVRLGSMSHYGRHDNHNRLMDVLLIRFGYRHSISASYFSQQTFTTILFSFNE